MATPTPLRVATAALGRLPRLAQPHLTSTMVRLIDSAIDGFPSFPAAKTIAAKALERGGDPDRGVELVIRRHLGLASAQGFLTNIGGIVSALIGIPANLTGIVLVQIRLVACLAHLYGYNIDDARVRTAIAMCVLGEPELNRLLAAGLLPSTPLAVATSPVYDPRLHAYVADRVLDRLLRQSGGKGLAGMIVRRTPILGGGVGSVADLIDTERVSRCARTQLVRRRPVGVGSTCHPAHADTLGAVRFT